MQIQEFLAQYPEAKENPLKYAVESKIKKFHWNGGSDGERITRSILLQDFVEEVNDLVTKIKEHEIKKI